MDIMPCIPLEAYSHINCRHRLILHIKEGRERRRGGRDHIHHAVMTYSK